MPFIGGVTLVQATPPVTTTADTTTLELTTIANQRVVVWATGNIRLTAVGAVQRPVELKYNGVTKCTTLPYDENTTSTRAFSLCYTETPGAGTHNITVESAANGGIENCKIVAMVFPE